MSEENKLQWKNETRKVSDLKFAEYNPRQMTEKQAEDLKASIDKFELVDPIVINLNNTIIGGHMRLRILKEKNVEDVDVRVPDRQLSLEEERELNVRLNKNLGEWNFDLLADFDLDKLKEIGFSSDELDKIMSFSPDEKDDDVPEIPEEPKSKLGEIYQLGNHRIMCGDSTKIEDVEKLMDGKKADMVFTDPPYGVSYENKTKSIANQRKDILPVANDELGKDALKDIVFPAFKNIAENLKNGGVYYVCSPQGGELGLMMMMMDAGIECRHMIVWRKNAPVFSMGRLDYDYQHEPILYGWRGSHKHIGNGQWKSSVWDCPRPSASKLHPTMKPVELIENAILNSAKGEDIVLDLFLGSGSTLIACEKTNRICMGMEIDNRYIDVIIDRYCKYTNNYNIKKNGQDYKWESN